MGQHQKSVSGLYKHFKNACPGGSGGGDLNHLRWTILDFAEWVLSMEIMALTQETKLKQDPQSISLENLI